MKIRIDGAAYCYDDTAAPIEDTAPVIASPQGIGFQGIQPIMQPTEIGEGLKELNLDTIEEHTRMTTIDMRAQLHPIEATSVLAMDALVALKVFPSMCLSFTRQKKRLSVSVDGVGRKQIVEVIGGKREMDVRSGLGGKLDAMKGIIGGRTA